ncbi:hypothetical protein MNEG_15206 [Monoraphidium neglectum]|uniref:Uncharacterized protein n=1 Tax=Monoraphidium neglectum TaxID=145388 RepID=A0A0D2LSJ1_9CHLO|nr:hypothetical protein MNEG_15206 [Monoraphidium neglectum]KIY92756.1 hypothetical protein MNEG_15206 [Monoraphidium neglectum]|eukprot:XP_013891776.1 hypothetical protein MNEG_15206 [Monoraphidium neglectum]
MERQNLVVYAVEGAREVSLGVASGLAFVWTGNLAAPYAGAFLMQALFSGYQRFCLDRQRRRRRAALARMQERSAKMRDAVAAAVASKKAREGAAAAPSADPADGAVGAADERRGAEVPASEPAGSSGGGVEQADERLTPAARVMLSDLEFRRSGGGAAALRDAQREADLAEIRAALADPPAAADPTSSRADGDADQPPGPGGASGSVAAEAEEADARLVALLSDMMRSPEGRGVVRRFKDASGGGGGGAGAAAARGTGGDDVSAYIEGLLSDPDVKARLVRELEARLCEMAEREEEGRRGGGGGGGSSKGGGGE